jgi:hypothetical protein
MKMISHTNIKLFLAGRVNSYSRSGVNQMWILKNSKELLENLKSRDFSEIDSIRTYDFSTLYTTVPYNSYCKGENLGHQPFKTVIGQNIEFLCKISTELI